jgi:four helix bundle protein
MNNYKNLEIWQKSIALAVDIYSLLKVFPKSENFNTIDQIRRCSISIASNIAEGAGRNSDKEFIHFLSISNGSSTELESLIIISNKLNFIPDDLKEKFVEKINEIQKMNRALQKHLTYKVKSKPLPPSKD